jgi:peptidylprolyl isomerase
MRARVLIAALALLLAAPAAAQTPPQLAPVDPENLLVIDTSKGRIIVELRPDIAPGHVARIRKLARKHYYDDNLFYRVIAGAFAQTGEKTIPGDPVSGEGLLKAELAFTPASPPSMVEAKAGFVGDMPVTLDADGKAYVRYCPGMAAMAHYDSPDTGDSQFFLTVTQTPYLERQFTAWGKILVGVDVIKALAPGEPPAAPDKMLKMRIASDIPVAERPKVSIAIPGTAGFDAAMAKGKKDWGAALNVCWVNLPVEVK